MFQLKKSIAALMFIAAFAITTAGCSSEASSSEDSQPANVPVTAETTTLSENQSQIAGTVTSIVGNEVVLALGEINESSGPPSGEGMENSSENSGGDSSDSMDSQGGRGQRDFSGEMPEGEMPEGERPSGGEMPEGDMSGEGPNGGNFGGNMGGSRVEITPTGETGTYLIPVGLTLTGISGSVSDFSAITEGMTLRLTLETDSDNNQNIVAVEVLAQ